MTSFPIEKKLMSKKIFLSTKVKKHLPKYYYRLIIENENKYYQNPNNSNLNSLIYLYKIGIEFFSIHDITRVSPFISKLSLLSSNHENLLLRYNYISLINKIKFLIENTNNEKYNQQLEKNNIKITKKKINKFNKKIKFAHLYINSYINEQKDNFSKKYKMKILIQFMNKKLIPDDSKLIEQKKKELKYQNNNAKKFNSTSNIYILNPIQKIFFDENQNLIKSEIENIKKKQNFKIGELIDNFFLYFISIYKSINNINLEKLINIIHECYKKKKNKYLEFSDNIKDFSALSEINSENNQFDILINSLKNDYEIDINNLEREVNAKISNEKIDILENKLISSLIENFMNQIIDNLFKNKQN